MPKTSDRDVEEFEQRAETILYCTIKELAAGENIIQYNYTKTERLKKEKDERGRPDEK